jgi:multiple sugar transport system substrate-binding protein
MGVQRGGWQRADIQEGSRTRRSVLAGLGGVAVGASALAGAACGATSANAPGAAATKVLKNGVTIQWGIENGPQTRFDLRNKQVQLFEAKFPGIKVDQVVNGSDVNKIKSTMAAGNPYDLIRITTTQYAGFANQNALVPLDDLIRRDKYDLKDFFPAAIAQWQWRGKQWAMPFLGVLTAYVNLAIVEKSGARKPPDNWHDPTWTNEAFLEFCRKTARQEGGKTVQFGFTGTHDNWRYYMPWVWANGGDMFDKDYKAVTLGDPPALEGIEFLGDLINKHHVAPTPDELKELGGSNKPFQDGKTAMMAASVNAVATNRAVANLRWTVTAYPRGKKGVAMGGGGVGWFITAGSKNHDETWELLKVVLEPDSDKLTALSGEAPPNRRSVAHDPEFLNPKEPPGSDMKVVVEALETALHTDPVLIQGDDIFGIMAEELGQIWAGKRSARETMEVIKQRVTPMLALERA